MSEWLKSVDIKTQMAGKNRLELLLFRLNEEQIYGINVFKIREVLHCPELVKTPGRHPSVRGIIHLRGHGTISVIDLNHAIMGEPLTSDSSILLITEYNQSLMGFLVGHVEQIINTTWNTVEPPPAGLGKAHYLTAITKFKEEEIVEILDVEKILSEISPPNLDISKNFVDHDLVTVASKYSVLVADDSSVARSHIKRILEQTGVNVIMVNDGLAAVKKLEELITGKVNITEKLLLMISDIEMPNMDGYTLTKVCRDHELLRDLFIILNSSISGDFNKQMAQKVDADLFLPKVNGNDIGQIVFDKIQERETIS